MTKPTAAKPNKQPAGPWWPKLLLLAGVAAAAGAAWWFFGDQLNLTSLAEREAELRRYQQENPLLVFGLAFVIYVAVTGLSLPGAAAMSLVYAWLFGFWAAVPLISFAATAGATLAFLLSRYVFGRPIQARYGPQLERFNRSLAREGPFFLFTLRLIPAVPFFVINLVMGLTPIRTSTFWWVSQLGMLPGTLVYVYAGSQFPSLKEMAEQGVGSIFTPGVIVAFTLLAVFPFVVRFAMARFAPRSAAAPEEQHPARSESESP